MKEKWRYNGGGQGRGEERRGEERGGEERGGKAGRPALL